MKPHGMKAIAATMLLAAFALASSTDIAAQTSSRKSKKETTLQEENHNLKEYIKQLEEELEAYKAQSKSQGQTQSAPTTKNEERAMESRTSFNLGDDSKDSISLWEAQDKMAEADVPSYNMDSVKFESSVSDDIYLERIKNMNNIFTLPYNDIVRNYVILYAEKRKQSMPTMLGLCSYYFPIFQEIFNKYGVPEELACMAIIESAMNPRALSWAGARGMWQFIYSTGKNYGLRIDSYVDERLDVYKAADAAARYLLDAYNRFGDWSLAISSYNCGPGNIMRAIERAGGKTSYWDIYPYLPSETRGYVPAFVGALYITKYYNEHGIVPKPAALPEKVDTFHINKKLHFAQINELVGVPMNELRNLNPQYVHDIVPGGDREYILRIPAKYMSDFVAKENEIYTYKSDSLFNPVVIKKITESSSSTPGGSGSGRISYKVKNGDNLGKIAAKYHTTVDKIKKWNNLKGTTIRAGQTLYIYGSGYSSGSSRSGSTQKSTGGSYTTYTVKKGDTLYGIARKYPGVTADQIMKLNGIGTSIREGQKIKIPRK